MCVVCLLFYKSLLYKKLIMAKVVISIYNTFITITDGKQFLGQNNIAFFEYLIEGFQDFSDSISYSIA